jgi:hypothetical protein
MQKYNLKIRALATFFAAYNLVSAIITELDF